QGRRADADDGDRRGQEDPADRDRQGRGALMPTRTPDEIRASIEQNRLELGQSIEKLRVEVQELTDWRSQLKRNQEQLVIVAAGTGFVVGGGIGGAAGL